MEIELKILIEDDPNTGITTICGDEQFCSTVKCDGTRHQIYKIIEYALKNKYVDKPSRDDT